MLDWSSPTDVVFGSEVVKTLKQHCKDIAINGQLCWRIQDQCIYYGILEELLQWAHEGNKLYSKRGILPKPFEGKLRRQTNLGKLQKHAYKRNMSVKHWRESVITQLLKNCNTNFGACTKQEA